MIVEYYLLCVVVIYYFITSVYLFFFFFCFFTSLVKFNIGIKTKEVLSRLVRSMPTFSSSRREPKDDLTPRCLHSVRHPTEEWTFIQNALWGSCTKKQSKSQVETRKSIIRRFINASQRTGKQYVLKAVNPLCSYFLWKCFPSYFLRLRYQLTPNDLRKMTVEELLELLRLSFSKKELELYRSVSSELESRLRFG